MDTTANTANAEFESLYTNPDFAKVADILTGIVGLTQDQTVDHWHNVHNMKAPTPNT
jgi:hypothetical protein